MKLAKILTCAFMALFALTSCGNGSDSDKADQEKEGMGERWGKKMDEAGERMQEEYEQMRDEWNR